MSTDVRTTIEIKGKDSASDALRKVQAALKGTADAGAHAATSTSAIGEKAGDMERGFMGLKDIIGGVADGPLGAMADRMGGIESVIKGFGPGMGAVGLAVGAVVLGASLLYEQMEKARKAAIDVQIRRLDAIKNDKQAMADELGVSGELLGVKKGIATVEETQAAGLTHATGILENHKAIYEAQKEKQTEKIALLRQEGWVLEDLLFLDKQRLARAKDAADQVKADNADLIRQTRAREEADAKIDATWDKRQRRVDREHMRVQQMGALEQEAEKLRKQATSSGEETEKVEKRRLDISRELRKLEADRLADGREGQGEVEARQARQSAAAQKAREAQKKADDERKKASNDYFESITQLTDKLEKDSVARADKIAGLADKVRQNSLTAGLQDGTAEAKEALKLGDLEIRQAQERGRILAQLAGDEEQQKLAMRDLDQRMAIEARQIHLEADTSKKAELDKVKAERDTKIDSAVAVASASVDALGKMGVGEQALSGIKAVVSEGEALLALTRGNVAGFISGTAAAGVFLSQAIGGSGQGAASPNATNTGGGFGTSTATQAGAATAGPTGVNVYFTKGFYGDAGSTAKAIYGTLKAGKSTGAPAWKGA